MDARTTKDTESERERTSEEEKYRSGTSCEVRIVRSFTAVKRIRIPRTRTKEKTLRARKAPHTYYTSADNTNT